MSRSIWKGPFSDLKIMKPVNKSISEKSIQYAHKENKKIDYLSINPLPIATTTINQKKATIITVWSRRSQILPAQVDKKFLVHNGRTFINVKCTQSMCSRKYGEFAVTRKKPSHKLNKRKQLHKNTR